ncbi:MAG: HNH endonuclease [Actinomycetota bacterium]|nr:HNH endonuclease [Actinomycetota bacterium]
MPHASDIAAAWAGVLEVAALELARHSSAPEEWSDATRGAVVDAVDRTARVLVAAKAPVLVAQDRSGAWRSPGVRSFEAFRAAKNREDIGAARRETAAARTLTELDGGVEALARGEMTVSHARRLGSTADKVDPKVRAELLTGPVAARVRDLAKKHEPKVFERKVEELAASRHPADVQDAHEAIRARRYLRIMPGPAGTRVEGLLDPVAGHRLQLAIEAASPRPGKDDVRPLGQRNADALEAIAATILAEGTLSPATHVPTQVMITMTEATFLAAREHLAAGSHAGASAATFPLVRAQDGPLLPPADLGRLLCGSAVGRLVVDADSVPLSVGRAQRTFKHHQRRTVELRDQRCAWPDCAQVARYCEVHHLDHWVEDHGETDVGRGVLVCTFHHHELHTHDLDLVVDAPPALPDGRRPPAGVRAKALPGDAEYEPPRYQVVSRALTADARRSRLAARLASRAAAHRAESRVPSTLPATARAPQVRKGREEREERSACHERAGA